MPSVVSGRGPRTVFKRRRRSPCTTQARPSLPQPPPPSLLPRLACCARRLAFHGGARDSRLVGEGSCLDLALRRALLVCTGTPLRPVLAPASQSVPCCSQREFAYLLRRRALNATGCRHLLHVSDGARLGRAAAERLGCPALEMLADGGALRWSQETIPDCSRPRYPLRADVCGALHRPLPRHLRVMYRRQTRAQCRRRTS